MFLSLGPLLAGAFLFLVLWPGGHLGSYNGVRSYVEILCILTLVLSLAGLRWLRNRPVTSGGGLHLLLLLPPAYLLIQSMQVDDHLMRLESLKLVFFTVFAWFSACIFHSFHRNISWLRISAITLLAASGGFLAEAFGLVSFATFKVPMTHMFVEFSAFGSSVFGGFGQRNVFASFLAAMTVWLIVITMKFHIVEKKTVALTCLAIFISAFALMLLGSKVGFIGLTFSLCFLCVYQYKRGRIGVLCPFIYSAVAGLFVGYLVGVFDATASSNSIERVAEAVSIDSSTSVRLDAIKLYFLLWLESPWFGSGEPFLWSVQGKVFEQPEIVGSAFASQIFSIRHGHNMLLQWLFEYGVLGVLFIIAPYLVWVSRLAESQVHRLVVISITLFPIVLHCLTEFPLLMSSLHWLLLVMIPISLSSPDTTSEFEVSKLASRIIVLPVGVVLFVMAGYLAFAEHRSRQTLLTQTYLQEWADYQQSTWHWMADPIVGVLGQDLAVTSMASIFVESDQHEMLPLVSESSERLLRNYPSIANYKRHIYLLEAMNSSTADSLQERLDRLIALRDGQSEEFR